MAFEELPLWKRMSLTGHWIDHPVDFVKSEYGLGIGEWDPKEELGVWPAQEEVITEFYNPTLTYMGLDEKVHTRGPYVELWLVAGMRSSKTWLEGTFGAIETFLLLNVDFKRKYNIGPSSPVYGLCVASKEQQALDTNFAQYTSRLRDAPYFAGMIEDGRINIFSKTVKIPEIQFTAHATSSEVAGEVGRTIKWLLVDEVDRFERTSGPRSGLEMYRLLTKGTRTFKRDGHSFFCGSPASYDSLSMRKLEEAKLDPSMLTYNRPTWEMNPMFSYEDFQEDFKKDPFGAMRDWAADPQAGSEVYFRNLEIIRWAETPNVLERLAMELPVVPERWNYVLTVDPASPKSATNAYGLAIGHKDGDTYIIDGVYRFLPSEQAEVDPIKLMNFIVQTEKDGNPGIVDIYPIRTFVSDTWNYPILQENIRRRGIEVKNNIVRRPHYETFKEALYNRQVVMPYYGPLLDELKSVIEVNVVRVDHPKHGSKDVADCVVQLVAELAEAVTPLPYVGVKII